MAGKVDAADRCGCSAGSATLGRLSTRGQYPPLSIDASCTNMILWLKVCELRTPPHAAAASVRCINLARQNLDPILILKMTDNFV